ncbi:MAG: 1-phosphofructokinase family hexose kinase [Acidimicrobiales bacterium]
MRPAAPMIVVASPNTNLDVVFVLSQLVVGSVTRAEAQVARVGGKPFNVARALRAMGVGATMVVLVGEELADAARQECAAARMPCVVVSCRAPARVCATVVELRGTGPATGRDPATVVNGPGEPPSGAELAAFEEALRSCLHPGDVLVLAGSMPAGVGGPAMAGLVSLGHAAGAAVVLDTSGEWLDEGLVARPEVVKVNRSELTSARGSGGQDAFTDGPALAPQARNLIVTAGPSGARAWLGGQGPSWLVLPPPVATRSSVGCGDAMTAGVAAGLAGSFGAPCQPGGGHPGGGQPGGGQPGGGQPGGAAWSGARPEGQAGKLLAGLVHGTAWAAATALEAGPDLRPELVPALLCEVRVLGGALHSA